MSLLFMDGFDHYGSETHLFRKWDTFNNAAGSNILPVGGRRGSGAWQNNSTARITKHIPNSTTVYVGVAILDSSLGNNAGIFRFQEVSSAGLVTHARLEINTSGYLVLYDAAGAVMTGGTSASPIQAATWYYIEMKLTVSNSSVVGDIQVRQDGVLVLEPAAGHDVQGGTNAYTNNVRMAGVDSNGGYNAYDDFYICNSDGATNNDFLGDVRIDTHYPDADGSALDWTPSTGSTHYALVDESSINLADYVTANTAGATELLGVQPLATTPVSIVAVQLNSLVAKTDSGSRTIKNTIKIGATEYPQSTFQLSDTALYNRTLLENNPATSSPWSKSDVDSAEFGVELT